MAQIKHNHFLDTVDQVFAHAKQLKILHLKAEGDRFTGRTIRVGNNELFHFGTTGYLGLEQDTRLKEAAKQAIERYGTQFPLSKSYIAHPLYEQLEGLLAKMYGQPVIVTKNATLAHMAAIPVLVGDKDAILLDHQVHWSVQDAAKRLKIRGVKIELVRHNRRDILEEKIQQLSSKVNRIWYMADGVYSMFGDFAPVKKLVDLSKKYKQLHLYFDDVHGMSWAGKHGCGYVMDKIGCISNKIVVVGTLSKTFGANGSFILTGNKNQHAKIKNFGGSLTFSAQLDPASVGAAIAAAKIHLSEEITEYQGQLKTKIDFFNEQIQKYKLPLVEKNESPVFFLATGIPETGYWLTRQLMQKGFFVNMGLFPAVPSKNTGLRITISRHNHKKEMESLAKTLHHLYPIAMQNTGNSVERLRKAFKMDFQPWQENQTLSSYKVVCKRSIKEIGKNIWDAHFGSQGILDWKGFEFLEEAFQNNKKPEDNWKFYYMQIKDENNELLAMGAFTISRWKEDLLAKSSISREIEKQREKDKYFFTANVLSLGSLFSDGLPCYIKQSHPQKEKILALLIKSLEEIAEKHNLSQIVLRDFETANAYNSLLQAQGFIPVNMPEVSILENINWNNLTEFKNGLSKKSRKHFEKDVQPFQKMVTTKIITKASQKELAHFYELYRNVEKKNIELNMFTYPLSVFEAMNRSERWEFIALYPIKEKKNTEKALGVMFCYSNYKTYVPSLVGLDYTTLSKYQTYRQLLFESINRAKNKKFEKVDFGVSANFEKRKMGARQIPKIAYLQANSNFSMDYMEMHQ
jgi:7-keto-8-aminopelargonate synthetase-like enzyme